MKVVDHPLGGAPPFDDVPVQPADPERREPVLHLALDPLRPAAEVPDPGRAAGRAARGHRPGATAVVASERLAGLVVDERPRAVGARRDVAAVPAEHHRGGAAPVDDEDRLLTLLQGGERGAERAREHPEVAVLQLGAEVDDLDPRRRPGEAGRQAMPLDLAVARPALGLDRRRR